MDTITETAPVIPWGRRTPLISKKEEPDHIMSNCVVSTSMEKEGIKYYLDGPPALSIRRGGTAIFTMSIGADDDLRINRMYSQVTAATILANPMNKIMAAFPDKPYEGQYMMLRSDGLDEKRVFKVGIWAMRQIDATMGSLPRVLPPSFLGAGFFTEFK
jgi:hypothetical protein